MTKKEVKELLTKDQERLFKKAMQIVRFMQKEMGMDIQNIDEMVLTVMGVLRAQKELEKESS